MHPRGLGFLPAVWAAFFALAAASPAMADDGAKLETVIVTAPSLAQQSLTAATVSADDMAARRAQTSDTAALFGGIAGVSLYQNGGVSSLPAIHGLDNARVNMSVDGMQVGVGCPNNMNPPLSYIDPSNVAHATVVAGITPVSVGGDSIAGTIIVGSLDPVFSDSADIESAGRVSGPIAAMAMSPQARSTARRREKISASPTRRRSWRPTITRAAGASEPSVRPSTNRKTIS